MRAAFGGRIPGFSRKRAVEWARETPDIDKLPERAMRVNSELCSAKYIDNENGAGATPNNGNVDYLGLRVWMTPMEFLSLAMPLSRSLARSADGLKKLMLGGGKIASPMLEIVIPVEWEDGDTYEPAHVRGHEGRNRMHALSELCGPDAMVEVHVFPRSYRARHLKPAWIEALRRSMYAQGSLKLVPGPLFVTEHDLAPNRRRSSKNRRRSSRKRR